MKKKMVLFAVCLLVILAISLPLAYSYANNNNLPRQIELGNKYLQEGDYAEAILAFEKAIKIDPINIDAHMGLSKAYLGQDKAEEAKAPLYVVLDLDDTYIEAYLLLAETLEKTGEIEEAYSILGDGIQATHEPELYLALADLKFRQGELEDAMLVLEEGIAKTDSAILKERLNEIRPAAPKANEITEDILSIELESSVAGWNVYYTTDGMDPVVNGQPYTQPIEIEEGETTIKAVSVSDQGVLSDVYEYLYIVEPEDESDIDSEIDQESESAILQTRFAEWNLAYSEDYSEALIYVVKGSLEGRNVTLFMTEGGVGYDGEIWYCDFADAWSGRSILAKETTNPPYFNIEDTRGDLTPQEYLIGDFQSTTDIVYLNEYLKTYHQFSDEDVMRLHASAEISTYGRLLDFYKNIIPEDEWYIVPDKDMKGISNTTYVESFVIDGREVLLFVDVISYKIQALDMHYAVDLMTGVTLYDRQDDYDFANEMLANINISRSDPFNLVPFAEYFKDITYKRAYDADELIEFYKTNIPEDKQYFLQDNFGDY